MRAARVPGHAKPFLEPAVPVVFIVVDDVSVRESLELLIRSKGWQAETFASANDFLRRPRLLGEKLPLLPDGDIIAALFTTTHVD